MYIFLHSTFEFIKDQGSRYYSVCEVGVGDNLEKGNPPFLKTLIDRYFLT